MMKGEGKNGYYGCLAISAKASYDSTSLSRSLQFFSLLDKLSKHDSSTMVQLPSHYSRDTALIMFTNDFHVARVNGSFLSSDDLQAVTNIADHSFPETPSSLSPGIQCSLGSPLASQPLSVFLSVLVPPFPFGTLSSSASTSSPQVISLDSIF